MVVTIVLIALVVVVAFPIHAYCFWKVLLRMNMPSMRKRQIVLFKSCLVVLEEGILMALFMAKPADEIVSADQASLEDEGTSAWQVAAALKFILANEFLYETFYWTPFLRGAPTIQAGWGEDVKGVESFVEHFFSDKLEFSQSRMVAAISGVVAVLTVLGVPLSLFADTCTTGDINVGFIWIYCAVVLLIIVVCVNCCCPTWMRNGKFIISGTMIIKFILVTLPLDIGHLGCNWEVPVALSISYVLRLVDFFMEFEACSCQGLP